MAKYADITGWGKCMPPAVMTNDDMATVLDTSDEWIRTRSGIRERRVSHVPCSDLASVAGHRALAAAGATVEERTDEIRAKASVIVLCASSLLVVDREDGGLDACFYAGAVKAKAP